MPLFSFLGKIAHGDSKPGGGAFGFLHSLADEAGAVGATVTTNPVREIAAKVSGNEEALQNALARTHEDISTTRQAAQSIPAGAAALIAGLRGKKEFQATNPGEAFLTGTEPTATPQGAYSSARQAGKSIPEALAVAGITGVSEVPIGPGKFLKGGALKDLAKASTEDDVTKVLVKNGMDNETAMNLAPAIAKSKDQNEIRGIITDSQPASTVPPPEPAAPTPEVTPASSVPVTPAEPPKLSFLANDQNTPTISQPAPVPTPEIPTSPKERVRGFLQNVQGSETTSPELKQAVSEVQPQTYGVKSNPELMASAQARVEKDPTGTLTDVLTKSNPSDADIAAGQELIRRAQASGNIDQAVQLTEHLDNTLREHGRSVQAASLWSRLSPEGILRLATRKVRAAREVSGPVTEKENAAVRDIQSGVESVNPQDAPVVRGTIQNTVKQIAESQQKLDLGGLEGAPQAVENTGQALAKNVEKAAAPAVKQKADTLVAELTKKVKQEYLEPKVSIKRSPTEILQEVFGRNAEAQDAYPLAQQILRDKYKDVPQMSEALDKFFGSQLSLPAANSTIDNAIREQLQKNGSRVSEAIYKSYAAQKQTVEDVAAALVKEGFDQESAHKLAAEVTTRLNKQFGEAKRVALENMARTVPKAAQATYLEKISKLSNLGALDKQDYIQLARAKLGLPDLSTESATRISELAQHLQTLPEGHEKYQVVRQIQREIASSVPKSKGKLLKEALGLPRTILASGDFSFGGRQALAYATSHPIRFAQQWPKQFKYFKEAFAGDDSQAFDEMLAQIRSHPDHHLLEKSGVDILDVAGHLGSKREEQFIESDLATRIPGLGRLVRASNYAYTGLANSLRANEFYAQIEHLRAGGIPVTDEVVKGLGKVINTATGRGDLGRFESVGKELSTALFAPRLIASRLSMMDPRYYINLPAPARKEALRNLMGLSTFAVGVLGLAKLAGLNVNTDPRNADFGKIRYGDTRFDILAGYTQYIRLGAQLATGERVNSTSGVVATLGEGVVGSRLDVLSNFLQGKENPSVSFLTTLLKGKDINGNDVLTPGGISKQIAQRFVPLVFQDTADLFSHENAANPATAIAGEFGVGVQTYGTQDLALSSRQKEIIDHLKSSGAPKDEVAAYTSFFQTAKQYSGQRQAVSDKINKALAANDIATAQKLAANYNNKLSKGYQGWVKKYAQYGDRVLTDSYNSQKIKLTSASIAQRQQTIINNRKLGITQ